MGYSEALDEAFDKCAAGSGKTRLKTGRNDKKTFILDTSILLYSPDAMFAFEENDIVLPYAVIEEIDNQKKRQDEVGRNARTVSRMLDDLREQGQLSEGIRTGSGGLIRIELNHVDAPGLPPGWDYNKKDNRILSVAYGLHKKNGASVHLVTKDLALRVKADVLGIAAEDYFNTRVDYLQLYSGVSALEVSAEEMDSFYGNGGLDAGKRQGFPHQFLVLKNRDNSSQSALCRYQKGRFLPLTWGDSINFGVKAKNKEQKFALELLLDDEVRIVTLVGCAGTGKTLLALAVGLEKVLEMKAYSRLLVTRPVVPMGGDIGYLPGTKDEKLRPWMQPIFDNLEFLFGNDPKPMKLIEHIMDRNLLELETLTYIRGRSIPRQFIICDEAQNLSPHMIKSLVTRVGEGTKIVFTGDPEQIDHPYLDASSNGLTYLVERLKGEEITGHVTLVKGERSRVAELGARLL